MKETSKVGLVLCLIGAVSLIFRGSVLANTLAAISVQVIACLLLLWGRLTLGRRGFHVSAEPTEGALINTGP
jgi:hypothetical protein